MFDDVMVVIADVEGNVESINFQASRGRSVISYLVELGQNDYDLKAVTSFVDYRGLSMMQYTLVRPIR